MGKDRSALYSTIYLYFFVYKPCIQTIVSLKQTMPFLWVLEWWCDAGQRKYQTHLFPLCTQEIFFHFPLLSLQTNSISWYFWWKITLVVLEKRSTCLVCVNLQNLWVGRMHLRVFWGFGFVGFCKEHLKNV